MKETRHTLPKIEEMRKFNRSGQALIEFALLLPMLLLLIFGVLEFGRAFQIKIVMENAAREGAHFFIYNKDDAPGFTETMEVVIDESQNSGVTILATEILVSCWTPTVQDDSCPSGSTVRVRVENQFSIGILDILTTPITMQSEARMYVP